MNTQMNPSLLILCITLIFLILNCINPSPQSEAISESKAEVESLVESAVKPVERRRQSIENRIKPPSNYQRAIVKQNSFQEFLRTLILKPKGSPVLYYNGSEKANNGIYSDVVDLDIGTKNLHQCADAIIRLRAEYLWKQKAFESIHFHFTNGFKVDYTEWMKGNRMKIDGNKTWWIPGAQPSNTYTDFWNYLELIFMYAGTASLEKELFVKKLDKAEIGDVLIQGGHPGHAVILIDKAIHNDTGLPVFLMAQSYMPAQEIQILVNPNNSKLSPWYSLDDTRINTPEWIFDSSDLKSFHP